MKTQFNLRIDVDVLQKIQSISIQEERSTSQQITFILKQYIKEYEKTHGEIPTTTNIKNSL